MVAEAPAGDDAMAVAKEFTPYFHGFIIKQRANEALTGMPPATFLIRAYTEVSVNSFVLSMLCRGQVRHHFIARPKPGECFAVNKSPTECTTLTDVIKFLREKRTFWPVPLQQGLKPVAPITSWPPEKIEFDTKAAAMEKLIQKYMIKPELNKDMAVRGALNKWKRTASGAHEEEDQPLYAKPKAVLDEAAAKAKQEEEEKEAAKAKEEEEKQASGDSKKDKKKKGSKKDKEDKKQAKSSKRGSKKDKSKKGEKGGAEEAASEATEATEATEAEAEAKAEASTSADDGEAPTKPDSKRGSKKEKRGSKKGLSRWFSSTAECQAAEDAGITEEDILASLAEFDLDDLAEPDIYGFPEDMDN